MKAKEVLKLTGISRKHLSRLVKKGTISVSRQPNGQYIYHPEEVYRYIGKKYRHLNIIYARVSTPKQRGDLARQIETLESFCLAQGVAIDYVFSDIASGINFEKRKQFFTLLGLVIERQVAKVFISYPDRLSRVGFDLFKHLFGEFGTQIMVANSSANEKLDSEEIINEIVTLIHCFSMKPYSKQRVKRAIEVLNEGAENET